MFMEISYFNGLTMANPQKFDALEVAWWRSWLAMAKLLLRITNLQYIGHRGECRPQQHIGRIIGRVESSDFGAT